MGVGGWVGVSGKWITKSLLDLSSHPPPSPQTVGVIVRLEKEEFKVLTQHGKVRGGLC